MQNGHVESFHGRLRDECPNVNWFPHLRPRSLHGSALAAWREDYNCERPHSSLPHGSSGELGSDETILGANPLTEKSSVMHG